MESVFKQVNQLLGSPIHESGEGREEGRGGGEEKRRGGEKEGRLIERRKGRGVRGGGVDINTIKRVIYARVLFM